MPAANPKWSPPRVQVRAFSPASGILPFPKAKGLLHTHLLLSHSLLKGQTCSKSQTAPKAKFDLGRQKPLCSSHAALTRCHHFLSSASESPGTPRNKTGDEFVPCNLLGCKFQCIRRKVAGEAAAVQVAQAGTLRTAQLLSGWCLAET